VYRGGRSCSGAVGSIGAGAGAGQAFGLPLLVLAVDERPGDKTTANTYGISLEQTRAMPVDVATTIATRIAASAR
jgi:hypothetical protein